MTRGVCIPDNKNHPDQKFKITKRGITFLELLNI